MRDQALGTAWLGAAVAAGAAAAVVGAFALNTLATPTDFAERLVRLEQQTQRIEALAGGGGVRSGYRAGAVCDGLGETAQAKLRQTLETAAALENLKDAHIQINEEAGRAPGGKITPVGVSLQAEGPYERLLAMTDRLAQGTPQIFVDTLDLKTQGPSAQLTLSGRAFCWTQG